MSGKESKLVVVTMLISLTMGIVLLSMLVYLPLRPLLEARVPTPVVEESIEVPLNGDAPVYTVIEYSGWVMIMVSGSVERDSQFYVDALHQVDDVQRGYQGGFKGFEIDGVYALKSIASASRPDYREDHIYRFKYYVTGDSPKSLRFQVQNEAASELDGVFIVEVSSDSFKGIPDADWR